MEKPKKSKALIITLIILAILAIVFFFIFRNKNTTKSVSDTNPNVFQSLFGTSKSKNLDVIGSGTGTSGDQSTEGNVLLLQEKGKVTASENILPGDFLVKSGDVNSSIVKVAIPNNVSSANLYGIAINAIDANDTGDILLAGEKIYVTARENVKVGDFVIYIGNNSTLNVPIVEIAIPNNSRTFNIYGIAIKNIGVGNILITDINSNSSLWSKIKNGVNSTVKYINDVVYRVFHGGNSSTDNTRTGGNGTGTDTFCVLNPSSPSCKGADNCPFPKITNVNTNACIDSKDCVLPMIVNGNQCQNPNDLLCTDTTATNSGEKGVCNYGNVCPPTWTGTYPNCVAPKVCPPGWTGTFPNCVDPNPNPNPGQCPPTWTGTYPNCVAPKVCPPGWTGTFPNCNPPAGPGDPRPDLTARAVSPTSAVINTPTKFSATVSNIGNSATKSSFNIFFRIKNNKDVLISLTNTTSPSTLGAKKEFVATASSTFNFTSIGLYSVQACADLKSTMTGIDSPGVIDESNENNNCGQWTSVRVTTTAPETCSLPKITDVATGKCIDPSACLPPKVINGAECQDPSNLICRDLTATNYGEKAVCEYGNTGDNLPDLTAGATSPTTATVSTTFSISSVIKNIGKGPTGGSFLTSFTIQNSKGEEKSVVSILTPAIEAGNEEVIISPLKYNFSQVGTYKVQACADQRVGYPNGMIDEFNEGNNCGPWTALKIEGAIPPPPDTGTPTVSVSANPANIKAGGTSKITWTSTNTKAKSCSLVGGSEGFTDGATSGSSYTRPLSLDTDITVTCEGTDGSSASGMVTVTIDNIGGGEPTNICLNIEQNPLTFTPEEKARLEVLLRKFYLISSTLKTTEDISTIYNEIDQQKQFIGQIKDLTTQCYQQVDPLIGGTNPYQWKRNGNPWYSEKSGGDFAYTNDTTGNGYLNYAWLPELNLPGKDQLISKNKIPNGTTADCGANNSGDCTPLSGYYYGTGSVDATSISDIIKIFKADMDDGVRNWNGDFYPNQLVYMNYTTTSVCTTYIAGICLSTDSALTLNTNTNTNFINDRNFTRPKNYNNTDDTTKYTYDCTLLNAHDLFPGYNLGYYSLPDPVYLKHGCQFRYGINAGDVEQILKIW